MLEDGGDASNEQVEGLELRAGDVRRRGDLLVLGRDGVGRRETRGIGLGLAGEMDRAGGANLGLCHLPNVQGDLARDHAQGQDRRQGSREEDGDDDRSREGAASETDVPTGERARDEHDPMAASCRRPPTAAGGPARSAPDRRLGP